MYSGKVLQQAPMPQRKGLLLSVPIGVRRQIRLVPSSSTRLICTCMRCRLDR